MLSVKTAILALVMAFGLLPLAACSDYTLPGSSTVPSSESTPVSDIKQQIDLTDLDGLTETYLTPILFSAATRNFWTDANTIAADSLVDMYGYVKIWNANIPESEMEIEDNTPYYYLDEAILDSYVQSFFDLSTEHLHSSDRYNADRKAYAFNMSGVGWAYDPHVLRAEHDEAINILVLYLNDGYGEAEGEAAILTIQVGSEGKFKYISNEAKPI